MTTTFPSFYKLPSNLQHNILPMLKRATFISKKLQDENTPLHRKEFLRNNLNDIKKQVSEIIENYVSQNTHFERLQKKGDVVNINIDIDPTQLNEYTDFLIAMMRMEEIDIPYNDFNETIEIAENETKDKQKYGILSYEKLCNISEDIYKKILQYDSSLFLKNDLLKTMLIHCKELRCTSEIIYRQTKFENVVGKSSKFSIQEKGVDLQLNISNSMENLKTILAYVQQEFKPASKTFHMYLDKLIELSESLLFQIPIYSNV